MPTGSHIFRRNRILLTRFKDLLLKKKLCKKIQPARTEEILKDLDAIPTRGITLFTNVEQSFGSPTH